MATYSIKAKISNHRVESTHSTFARARSGTGSLSDSASGATMTVQQRDSGGSVRLGQIRVEFDTSAIISGSASGVSMTMNFTAITTGFTFDVFVYPFASGTDWVDDGLLPARVGEFAMGSASTGRTTSSLSITSIPVTTSYGVLISGDAVRTGVAPAFSTPQQTVTRNQAGTTADDIRIDFTITPPPPNNGSFIPFFM